MIAKHLRLVRPVRAAMHWSPLLLTSIVAVLIAAVFAKSADLDRALNGLRVASVLLAVGASFAFDGQARELETPTPTGVRALAVLRMVMSGGVVALVLLVATRIAASQEDISFSPELFVEAGTLVVVAWAAGLWTARRFGTGLGGIVGGSVVLTVSAVAALLPPRWAMFAVYPFEDAWVDSRWRWAATLLIAGTLGAMALRNRE